MNSSRVIGAAAIAVLVGAPSIAGAQQFGPFDYYDPPQGAIAVVERVHFGPRTELYALRGSWCAYWFDLNYTLQAFPNHPKALVVMSEFLEKHRPCTEQILKERSSPLEAARELGSGSWEERNADYYFRKGIEFRPKQIEARVLYGSYLRQKGRTKEALRELTAAQKIMPNSADVHYQLGMVYLDIGDSNLALEHARKAYSLGKPPADLKTKLIEAKLWKNS